jgi:hypothetical protein
MKTPVVPRGVTGLPGIGFNAFPDSTSSMKYGPPVLLWFRFCAPVHTQSGSTRVATMTHF